MNFGSHLYQALIPLGLILGHIAIGARIFRAGPQVERAVRWLALMWSVVLAAAWLLRFFTVGRLPLIGMYESTLSVALATVVVAALWESRHKGQTTITPLAVLVAAALMSHGYTFESTPSALEISSRSWAADGHALVACLAFAVLALSNFLALRIVLGRTEGDDLERPMVSTLRVGFGLLSAMIVSGSVYRFMQSRAAWTFDPVEIAAVVIWLAYAALILLQALKGWKGKRLAGCTLFVFVLLLVSQRGLVYLPSGQSFHVPEIDRQHPTDPQANQVPGTD